MKEETIRVEVISGVEGPCLSVNSLRVAGPKPWGGGRVIHAFDVPKKDIIEAASRLPRGAGK